MLLCPWFVDLELQEAVLETWSLTHSINIYGIYSQGMQLQEPQISSRLGISPKLIRLTLCLWQKNPGFRKNSVCSLVWPDFDSFESANWPLKSSTNFRIWWKICFCLWSAQVAYSKVSEQCSFRCKFELASPKRPVWHMRVLPRITANNMMIKINLNGEINFTISYNLQVFLVCQTGRLGLASSNLHRKLHSWDAFE